MNELDRLIETYEPLTPPLDGRELDSLKKRVQGKICPKRRHLRLMLALAACMCLLAACGAVAMGLFGNMADTNQTAELVERYGLALEDAPSAEADGHTVTIRAIIRSDNIARIVYDISGSKRQILSWDTFRDGDGTVISRLQFFAHGQPSRPTQSQPDTSRDGGHNSFRQSGPIGKTGTGSYRWFADMDLPEDADSISLHVLSQSGEAEIIEAPLPDPVPEKTIYPNQAPIHLKTVDGETDITIESITVTPFRLKITGTYSGTQELFTLSPDWKQFIRLYGSGREEIRFGKDGSFYGAGGGIGPKENPVFDIDLGSYDLINPAEVTEIELDGVSYQVP